MNFSEFYKGERDGICERYRNDIDEAASKHSLAELLDINMCQWFCAYNKEKGISNLLCENFDRFINGKFVSHRGGYNTEVYCRYDKAVTIRSTITGIIESDIEILVPDNMVCRIMLADSKVKITLGSKSVAEVFLDDTVVIENADELDERVTFDKLRRL